MTSPAIRVARASDAQDIAQLTAQLGYDVTVSSVTQRLSRILPRQDQYFLVVEVDGHLVGWLHAAMAEFVESPAFVVIGGLVVDRNHRRKASGAH